MRHVVKQVEPRSFFDWKALASGAWQPTYDALSGAVKRDVKMALVAEQGHICCYCQRRLINCDSHIEHFQPQSDPAVDPLDFDNLLCSCQDQIKKREPRHSGNLKEDWFDLVLLISPFDPGCEDRFSYTGDGRIKPASNSDQSAKETIRKSGLDIEKLNALREKAIEPFLDDQISEDDMREFVSGYLMKDAHGRYGEFWTTIRYVFQGYVVV